jgi:hypothetical protein
MTYVRTRLAAITVAALLLLTIGASAAVARVTPDLEAVPEWGWVTVRLPTSTYDPAPKDQGNSSDSTNHVSYDGNGRYTVVFEHLEHPGGTVHVTPLGATTNTCEVVEWGPSTTSPDLIVNVACYTRLGVPTAQRFSLSWLATASTTGRLAYLWADEETAASYTAHPTYSYNSRGGTNTVQRSAIGRYVARLRDLGSMKGSVQVTAYETTGAPPTSVGPATAVLPSACTTGGWGPSASGDDMLVTVYCRDSNGAPTDSRFDLTFMQGLGLKGQGGDRVAYLWADRSTAASYTPDARYWFSTAGQAPRVTRQGTGSYTATLPGMPKGGGVQVTAQGGSARRCVVKSISLDTLPQRIGVRCYDFDGDPANAKFTLAYER